MREGADPALARRPLLLYPSVRADGTPPGERGVARGDARSEQPKDALQDPLPIRYRSLRPRRTPVAQGEPGAPGRRVPLDQLGSLYVHHQAGTRRYPRHGGLYTLAGLVGWHGRIGVWG